MIQVTLRYVLRTIIPLCLLSLVLFSSKHRAMCRVDEIDLDFQQL